MNHPFGWDLPPGVSLSDPGGPHDPERMRWEAAVEAIEGALHQASMAGLTVAEINQSWAEAAEQAYYDDLEDREKEEAMYWQMEEDGHRLEEAYNNQDYPDDQDLRGD